VFANPAAMGSMQPWARGGVATVPAHEVDLMSPERQGQLKSDWDNYVSSQQDIARAQQHQAEDAGVAASLHAKMLADQNAENLALSKKQDEEIRRIEDARQKMAHDVANMKLDPNRWWNSKSTGEQIMWTLAKGLSGFVQGFSAMAPGGHPIPNVVAEKVNQHISQDLQAQQAEIEQKKGEIGDMDSLLASAFRRTGNMRDAMALAHTVALQQADSEQQAYAAGANSEYTAAQSKALSAQLQQRADEYMASTVKYVPKQTVGTGTNYEAEYQAYRKKWAQGDQKTPLMSREEYMQTAGGAGHASTAPVAGQAQSLANVKVPGAPESVEWHPEREIQGTDAQKKYLAQQQYNFQVTSALKKLEFPAIGRSGVADVG
jgi:hypothetical protein